MSILIGDCHGRIERYLRILKEADEREEPTMLLGELGFKKEHDWFQGLKLNPDRHKIVFGNHDYFPYLNKPYSMGRFKSWSEPKGTFFSVAGAYSIDKQYRREGVTWFADEEMNLKEQTECLALYEKCKPAYVLTHDGPESVIDTFFNYAYKFPDGNNTNKFYDILLSYHKPKAWVFAHHHKSRDMVINGTRFICLDEMETFNTKNL